VWFDEWSFGLYRRDFFALLLCVLNLFTLFLYLFVDCIYILIVFISLFIYCIYFFIVLIVFVVGYL
jgi:hypothetical protein